VDKKNGNNIVVGKENICPPVDDWSDQLNFLLCNNMRTTRSERIESLNLHSAVVACDVRQLDHCGLDCDNMQQAQLLLHEPPYVIHSSDNSTATAKSLNYRSESLNHLAMFLHFH
jgi:hypothetical protein